MAKLLKLRLGVADDPSQAQPSLNDCLEAMVRQGDLLMTDVIAGLLLATAPAGARKIVAFQAPAIKRAVEALHANAAAVCEGYKTELSRIVYEGGGKEQAASEVLRFDDLQMFGDEELDLSIEVARGQQEVLHAVEDVIPAVDALMSTLLGWRTIQPGLNPLRPEVFVRALQACLALHVTDASVRDTLITPAAGLLGANLRKLYRELADWLLSSGLEPAVPLGGKTAQGSGASGATVVDSVSKTLLTLTKLRKLLSGDLDPPPHQRVEFLHTVPASMAMLQDMKQVDALVKRLEQRPRPPAPPPAAPVDLLAEPDVRTDGSGVRLGRQLGEEVVRLMFDNLTQDSRLVQAYKRALKAIEPAVLKLAEGDSRFFSDRTHPARQLLDRMTQRSLAFSAESDPGWHRFLATVEDAVKWLDSKVIDADTFAELLAHLQAQWAGHDQGLNVRREEAAKALLHAEQRNLLAQKIAADFNEALGGVQVADFITDFLRNSWAQVVAETQLSCADGSDDPFGYRALADDLIWSVQKSTAQRGRTRRLAQMVPSLLTRLREGLQRIDYPPELTSRFFDNLVTVHQSALKEGKDADARAAADAVEAQMSDFSDSMVEVAQVWLAENEAIESGWFDEAGLDVASPAAADLENSAEPGPAPVAAGEMRTGTWVELIVNGEWLRVQLTWASPHGTLFMFTSLAGTAHSMSKRMLERLRASGHIKVVAERGVVDDALDKVAKAALKNSLDNPG